MKLIYQTLGICALSAFMWLSFDVRAGELEAGFKNPPPAARPWVYWFPLDGNITSNGITADLEAMRRAGIGGVLYMETDVGTPPGPAAFGGPRWRNLFKYICSEANRLGLEVNMNNDAGWAGSGGPWITPELSMQKVVWSETQVQGPLHFDDDLPQPETVSNYYRDIAVLAFPTPAGETVKMSDDSPAFSSSLPADRFNAANLVDDDPATTVQFPKPRRGQPDYIQIEFARPFAARHLSLTLGDSYRRTINGEIQISDDGKTFKTVREFETKPPWVTLAFDKVVARYYRIVFTKVAASLPDLTVAGLKLSPACRIDLIEAKSDLITRQVPLESHWPKLPSELTIPRDKVVEISSRMNAAGHLTWNAPPGNWTILRIGHTSTGQNNYPAPSAGRGLECDKLSKAGAKAAFDGLMGTLIKDVGLLAGKTLVSTHIDSWEVKSQNWTPKFREEFKQLRGYDPLPFLPVITGRVVGSLEVSERFLWDWRETISDLLVSNYAGEFQKLAHQHGLRLSIEAYDYVPCDEMKYAGRADEPMGEFWAWSKFGAAWSCDEMASAAHVYGKQILGAEAFTSGSEEKWQSYPGNIKDLGDWAFSEGINRFVFHRYALQPWTNAAPGMSMGPYGLHYERTQTWWELAKAWHEYLARCQFLLQQGLWNADVCYLSPENAPQRWLAPEKRDDAEYNFDGCPPEVVLTRMKVKDGRLVLPDGMSYRLLVLPDSPTMTPGLLHKIAQLVNDGATVIGSRPVKSPSLTDYPRCDAQVRKLADKLWGDCDGKAVKGHRFGKGRIIQGKTADAVLAEMNVPPDFSCQDRHSMRDLRYTHRTIGDTEIYFVANKNPDFEQTLCSFRVQGRRPELWWPDTGRIERPAIYNETNGCIRVPIWFQPNGSVFVVFRKDEPVEPDRILSASRNGEPMLATRLNKTLPDAEEAADDNAEITNSFTMAVWAKPSVDIDLPVETNHGIGTDHKRNDALYPPPGHEVYGDEQQAGSGVSIGRNGVCVYEHSASYFAPILVCAAPITNWTHVAVVYRDGQPSLYLDGQLVREGKQSRHIVHPCVGVKHGRTVPPFHGALGRFKQYDRALTGSEIAALAKSMPVPPNPKSFPDFELSRAANGTLEALVWKPGDYEFNCADGRRVQVKVASVPEPFAIAGPWDVHFMPGRGAPDEVRFNKLISWSESSDPGVKYFSGTATYTKTFDAPADLTSGKCRVILDLGRVDVMAEVKLNGHDLGILWKPPFVVDVTGALKPGGNHLEVKVVNLWINRMIGDEQLPEDSDRNANGTLKQWPQWLLDGKRSPTGRYTFTSWRLWKKDDSLVASGLLGPVKLRAAAMVHPN